MEAEAPPIIPGEENKIEQENREGKPEKNDKKHFFRFIAILSVILLVSILFKFPMTNSGLSNNAIAGGITDNAVEYGSEGNGNSQTAKMHVENGQYILKPNTFKVGSKIRIEADVSRIPGCAKSIIIPAFGVRKNLELNNNIIEFTPDKAGTFNIACSMNMYRGTFTVLESDGGKANYVEKTSASQGSCGGAGRGCGGCGG